MQINLTSRFLDTRCPSFSGSFSMKNAEYFQVAVMKIIRQNMSLFRVVIGVNCDFSRHMMRFIPLRSKSPSIMRFKLALGQSLVVGKVASKKNISTLCETEMNYTRCRYCLLSKERVDCIIGYHFCQIGQYIKKPCGSASGAAAFRESQMQPGGARRSQKANRDSHLNSVTRIIGLGSFNIHKNNQKRISACFLCFFGIWMVQFLISNC